MKKGYWVVHLDVERPEEFAQYGSRARAALEMYGGKLLARSDGEAEVLEGTLRSRHVLVEFPSVEQARTCYHSEEYQAAIALREHCAAADFLLIAGA